MFYVTLHTLRDCLVVNCADRDRCLAERNTSQDKKH